MANNRMTHRHDNDVPKEASEEDLLHTNVEQVLLTTGYEPALNAIGDSARAPQTTRISMVNDNFIWK